MVQSIMYCVEQIVVPEKFPDILKAYAKAVIRTQPYDLLRWSAAYFRCMAVGVTPPIKYRLEKEYRFENLTKGYLKALLGQIGKGYFINKDVLINKWSGLCLPEEQLLKLLSLCRMLNNSEIHWLKLFAVMVGSINTNFHATVNMLCELLTEEPEGGPSPIPMWMFRECYQFISQLDCSELQHFENGLKILNDGTLEDIEEFIQPSKIYSSQLFTDILLDEQLYNFDSTSKIRLENTVLNKICDNLSANENVSDTVNDEDNSNASEISSTFKFCNFDKNSNKIIGATMDFDSIILLLNEAKGYALTDLHNGPTEITEKTLRHAKKREAELLIQRERQSEQCTENTRKYLHEERVEILKEFGSPWSWLHQFASHNCRNKSYNFIDETQSIASDVTPSESTDESFDYQREKYISAVSSSTDNTTEKSVLTTVSDNSIELEKILFNKKSNDESPAPQNPENTKKMIDTILNDIINILSSAESNEKLEISNTSSMVSYLKKEELGVLERAGEAIPNFNTNTIIDMLQEANQNGIIFNDLNELHVYLKQTFIDRKIYDFALCATDEKISEFETEPSEISDIPLNTRDGNDNNVTMKCRDELPSADILPTQSEDKLISESDKESTISESKHDGNENLSSVDTNINDHKNKPIEKEFIECGLEIDQKILNKPLSETMILGLAETQPSELIESESTVLSEQSHITTTATDIIDEKYSDISSKVYEQSDCVIIENIDGKKIRKTQKENIVMKDNQQQQQQHPSILEFNCVIPAMPGIGKPISKKTIENFLTYIKFRSREEKGMVFPRHFKEDKCPNMLDCIGDYI